MTGDMAIFLIGSTALIGGFNLCFRGRDRIIFNVAMVILFVCVAVAIARS